MEPFVFGGAKPLTTDNTDRTDFALHEPAESCGTAAPAVRGRTPARAPVPHVRGRVGRRRIKNQKAPFRNEMGLFPFYSLQPQRAEPCNTPSPRLCVENGR